MIAILPITSQEILKIYTFKVEKLHKRMKFYLLFLPCFQSLTFGHWCAHTMFAVQKLKNKCLVANISEKSLVFFTGFYLYL